MLSNITKGLATMLLLIFTMISHGQDLNGFTVEHTDSIDVSQVEFYFTKGLDWTKKEKLMPYQRVNFCPEDTFLIHPKSIHLKFSVYQNDSLFLESTRVGDTSGMISYRKEWKAGVYSVNYWSGNAGGSFKFFMDCWPDEEPIIDTVVVRDTIYQGSVRTDTLYAFTGGRIDTLSDAVRETSERIVAIAEYLGLAISDQQKTKIEVMEEELQGSSVETLRRKYYKSKSIVVQGYQLSTCDFADYAGVSCSRSEATIFEIAKAKSTGETG